MARDTKPSSERRRQYDRVRSQTPLRQLYRSRRWTHELRPRQLAKERYCRLCRKRGVMTLATDVDHLVRHFGDTQLFHDPNNLQSLCAQCHSGKTRSEMTGNQMRGHDANGYPVDASYHEAMQRFSQASASRVPIEEVPEGDGRVACANTHSPPPRLPLAEQQKDFGTPKELGTSNEG